jgi:NADH:ubiquinone oxidoreductase subunit B-like Fe-S oxidoreductase
MEEGFTQYHLEVINEESSLKNTQTVIQKLIDWFRTKSMFVLAYGTGCGAIEMPPMFTSRYDIERLGVVGVASVCSSFRAMEIALERAEISKMTSSFGSEAFLGAFGMALSGSFFSWVATTTS